MRVWVFVPPLPRISGGLRVLLQLAEQLQGLDALAAVLVWETPPLAMDLPWSPVRRADLAQGDVLLLPEGWPNALAFGLRAGCRVVVYCQNWAYLFHGLAPGVRWRDLPVSFLAVSHPVAWYAEQVLGVGPSIVRPVVDRSLFVPSCLPEEGRLRVAFMPRKNKALAETAQRILAERALSVPLEWVPIHGLPPAGVAEVLASCAIFAATGFPEGCPLPPPGGHGLRLPACGLHGLWCLGLCLPVGLRWIYAVWLPAPASAVGRQWAVGTRWRPLGVGKGHRACGSLVGRSCGTPCGLRSWPGDGGGL